jgi:hypothetical protein
MSLRKQLREKLFELVAEVEHGEAFYEGGRMLEYFMENCDEVKRRVIGLDAKLWRITRL